MKSAIFLVRARRWALAALACVILSGVGIGTASAQTRTLKFYNVHTKERAVFAYKRNGRYDQGEMKKINWFLRDWRQGKATTMDPQLLDLIWEAYRQAGASDYINVISAYRSPATNGMLRRTRGGQAKKSQHMVGRALDFFIPGVRLSTLRAIGLKMQVGGVGFYPKSGSPFVHFDTGNARHWPRMNRSQLVALFPNGGTVHVPSDGKPLPGYQQALAAYKQRRAASDLQVANASSSSGGGKTLLSMLFGGGDEDEGEDVASAPVQVARAQPQRQPQARAPQIAGVVPTSRPSQSMPAPAAVAMLDAGFDTSRDARNAPAAAVNGQIEETAVAALDPRLVPSPRWAPARAVPATTGDGVPAMAATPDATAAMIAALESQADEERQVDTQLAYTVPMPSVRPAFSSVLQDRVAAVIPDTAPEAPPALRQVSLPAPSVRPARQSVSPALQTAAVQPKPMPAQTAPVRVASSSSGDIMPSKGGWTLNAAEPRPRPERAPIAVRSEDEINARIEAALFSN